MPRPWSARAPLLLLAILVAASCTRTEAREEVLARRTPAASSGRTEPAAAPVGRRAPSTAKAQPPTPRPQIITEQAWIPFASAGEVTLTHPSAVVERVAFHESNHDGARQLEPLDSAIAPTTLETRERGTGSRTAADIVADPNAEIRSPVTGTVKRSGTYVLYCDNKDSFVVIAPDSHPGWEVKILHIRGVNVRAGDRVVARKTVLAPGPAKLPFESQVDEISDEPAWPHVHIEIVDPAIPDRPSPGGGCN